MAADRVIYQLFCSSDPAERSCAFVRLKFQILGVRRRGTWYNEAQRVTGNPDHLWRFNYGTDYYGIYAELYTDQL